MSVEPFPLWIPITKEQFIESHRRYARKYLPWGKTNLEIIIRKYKDKPDEMFYMDHLKATIPVFKVICEYRYASDDGKHHQYFIRKGTEIDIPSEESVKGKFKLEYLTNADTVRESSKPVRKSWDKP